MGALLKTVDLFDLIKSKHQLTSDYQLAKMLGVTAGLICKHRKTPFGISNDLALRCAALLNLDKGYVIACANAERAKCAPEREAFSRLAGLSLAYAKDLKPI